MTVGAMAETGIALISTDCVSIAVRRNYHGGVSDGHLRLYGPRTARDCLKLRREFCDHLTHLGKLLAATGEISLCSEVNILGH